ncbi:MAG: DUF5602 domain-containing protein [Flavisolibacter sp.]|nr:DUF5602 domain-containing protein [Flavisolibacter sp.]
MKCKQIAMLLLTAALLFSCQKEIQKQNDQEFLISKKQPEEKTNTFYGPQVKVGAGHVRSFIIINHNGEPVELGVEMTRSSMEDLPEAPHEAMIEHPFTYWLPLHPKAKQFTPYQHIELNWQPIGHPPFFFAPPHFDIHFYTISKDVQMSIPQPTPSNIHLFGPPSPGYLPEDYIIPGAPIAQMGRHWLDRTSPVLSPPFIFQHVMIYGTFDGKVVFLEPMVTRNFLLSNTETHVPIKQPAIYDPNQNYYPTMYNIYSEGNKEKIYVSLSHFEWR